MNPEEAPVNTGLRARVAWLVSGILLVVLILSGSFAAGFVIGRGPGLMAQAEENSAEAPQENTDARDQPTVDSSGLRIRTCSVSDLTTDERLGALAAVVIEPLSGEVLFSRNSDLPATPASVAKIVTGAAALEVLGPDRMFTTSVVQESEPGTIVLVAGGDPTLSTVPEGSESVYVGAPKMAALAQQVVSTVSQSLAEGERVRITEVVVDNSLWADSEVWNETWSADARAKGFISQVTALQVDGDRREPAVTLSRRSDDAEARAARAFTDALRAAGNTARFVTISEGTAAPDAVVLGQVQSRPVSELVSYMLKESDNTLAEYLARHVAYESGRDGTFESVGPALASALAPYGLPEDQISLSDGSGLSPSNKIQPRYVASLLMEASSAIGAISQVVAGLPIAGVDGSLDDRFQDPNQTLTGRVSAKTGSITGVRSLAGIVTADDSSDLVFAVFAQGEVGDESREAIENLVAGFSVCGENLADF